MHYERLLESMILSGEKDEKLDVRKYCDITDRELLDF